MGAGGREPGYQAIAARDQVLDDQVQVGKGGQPVSQRLPDGVDADGPARGMLDDIGGQELVQVVQPLVVRTRLGPLNTLVIGDNSRWDRHRRWTRHVRAESRRDRTHLARSAANQEIAAALVISHKTVKRHLDTIFARLGVSSRTAAATFAVRAGLV